MAYLTGTKYNALDAYPAASQNQDVDNDTWLYDNLRTEIASYHPDRPSAVVVLSDEFNAGALDVAWTAYGGIAASAVTFPETGAIDRYDLASFPGWIAFQSDNSGDAVAMTDLGIRQAYTPGTGPWAVIAKVAIHNIVNANQNQQIGVGVSDNTTPSNYNNVALLRTSASGWKAECWQGAGSIANSTEPDFMSLYIAIIRESAGGSTSFWFSPDGMTWDRLGATATAIAVGYLWVYVRQSGPPTNRPIYLVDWVRTFDTATLICGRGGDT